MKEEVRVSRKSRVSDVLEHLSNKIGLKSFNDFSLSLER